MKDKVVSVVVAGLGGQGVIKASDILADAAFRAGLDIKKSELHGMSQRGGSVSSDVRFGPRVFSPMVPDGTADFLVVLEPTQVEPNRHVLAPDGVILTPDAVDAEKLPNRRSLNVAMLGLLSVYLDIDESCWRAAMESAFAARYHQANAQAFALGRDLGNTQRAQ